MSGMLFSGGPGGLALGGSAAIDPATIFQTGDDGIWCDLTDPTTMSQQTSGTPRFVPGNPDARLRFIENLATNSGNVFAGVNLDVLAPSTSANVRWDGGSPGGVYCQPSPNDGTIRTAAVALASQPAMEMICAVSNITNPGTTPRYPLALNRVNFNPGTGSQSDSHQMRMSQTNGFILFRGQNAQRGLPQIACNLGLPTGTTPFVAAVRLDPTAQTLNGWFDGVHVVVDQATPDLNAATDLGWTGTDTCYGLGILSGGFSTYLTGIRVHAIFGISRILSDVERRGIELWMANLVGITLP